MKKLAFIALLLLVNMTYGITLTKYEFTKVAQSILIEKDPNAKVEIIAVLEIGYTDNSGKNQKIFLENAYANYLLEPGNVEDVLNEYISLIMAVQDSTYHDLSSINNIVPTIRDRTYIAFIDSLTESDNNFSLVTEKLNDELYIVYARDDLLTISTLGNKDFKELEISQDSLRILAINNLRRILTDQSCFDYGGTYAFIAGGNYESSMLLFNELWNHAEFPVNGEYIAAVPARDLLMVTGSQDSGGIEMPKEFVNQPDSLLPYPISKKLFIRRNSTWEIYNDEASRFP